MKSGTHTYILKLFSQSHKYFELCRICIQLRTPKTQHECYLYIKSKLTIYNGQLNIRCHIFTSMQPSSSISFHVSFNNCLILSIYTSFDCVKNVLKTFKFTKSRNPTGLCLTTISTTIYTRCRQIEFVEIFMTITIHFDFNKIITT